jgi:hypothetical protein
MLLIALLPYASARYGGGRGYGGSYNAGTNYNTGPRMECTWKESCNAVDFCAIKHSNDDMMATG